MDEKEELKMLRSELDNKIISRAYQFYKSVDKQMRDSIYTTKKELDEQAYKNYVKAGFLARKIARLNQDEDANEEELDKLYERQSALTLKEDNLREMESAWYDNYERLSKIKDNTENTLLKALKFRDEKFSNPYLPRISGYKMSDVERLVRELRNNKK
jgi:hypothetical protein